MYSIAIYVPYIHICILYACMYPISMYVPTHPYTTPISIYVSYIHIRTLHPYMYPMGWLRSVGSIKLWVSFAEYRLFYRALLQKRPIILSILLPVATPYIHVCILFPCMYPHIHIYCTQHKATHDFFFICFGRGVDGISDFLKKNPKNLGLRGLRGVTSQTCWKYGY